MYRVTIYSTVKGILTRRVIGGPSTNIIHQIFLYTITLSSTLLFYYIHHYLSYYNYLPYFHLELFFTLLTVSFGLTCSFKDPGIVTMKSFWFNDIEEKVPDNISWGQEYYKIKYCNICNLNAPPKTSHCHICNNCVKGFDHHCHLLNNCIGEWNRKAFLLFLIFGALKGTVGIIITCYSLFVLGVRDYHFFSDRVLEYRYLISVLLLSIVISGIAYYYKFELIRK